MFWNIEAVKGELAISLLGICHLDLSLFMYLREELDDWLAKTAAEGVVQADGNDEHDDGGTMDLPAEPPLDSQMPGSSDSEESEAEGAGALGAN